MKKLILTLCLAATGTFAAVAQMRLTLDQALDLALSENPTVKVAEMEVQRYDYVKRQTWGGLLPQVWLTCPVTDTCVRSLWKAWNFSRKMRTHRSFSAPVLLPEISMIRW